MEADKKIFSKKTGSIFQYLMFFLREYLLKSTLFYQIVIRQIV